MGRSAISFRIDKIIRCDIWKWGLQLLDLKAVGVSGALAVCLPQAHRFPPCGPEFLEDDVDWDDAKGANYCLGGE